jgi:hypothetical protein
MRKHGYSIMQAIGKAIAGKPWFPTPQPNTYSHFQEPE